ncbi:hypothetical protein BB559_001745 [Furculomyces boomerangus]|uniref:Amino acid permease/ SLC12A domain-containing protein n=2 Tax=Harpellales TaxID=61421 RepID=A0A2T9Z118_9FUNG|nr:hypothetical protein BB559_005663 [Furculomyces boomerangus]PVU98246.1 hypothetical protein BB559_001745 [Furculomyces boomerangus]PWA03530.1 hypothetical protein BB558_000314 [Smittium angustum]
MVAEESFFRSLLRKKPIQVTISFIIAGVVSAISAFSYAEMSSMIPIAGSAYTYALTTMGELIGWIVGWDLMLEYLVGASTVAVGWSGYLAKAFKVFWGVTLNKATTQTPIEYIDDVFSINKGVYINIPAILILLIITTILVIGIRESSWFNNVIVGTKLIVILFFIFGGIKYIDKSNYTPFIPPTKNGQFGGVGIIKGAQKVFFAYIGFDAVSTAAQEAKNPQRDLPIGICISLLVCTLLYIATVIVLCGVKKYTELNSQAPVPDALEGHPGVRWLQIIIYIGAIAGLTSVLLIGLLSQPRLFMSMANDGMMPQAFARIHPRFKTPAFPTMLGGGICMVLSGFLPVDLLGDMTSVGTLLAFGFVNVAVIIARFTMPDQPRAIKVPFGPFVLPLLGTVISKTLKSSRIY